MTNTSLANVLESLNKARTMTQCAMGSRQPQLARSNSSTALVHIERAIRNLKEQCSDLESQ